MSEPVVVLRDASRDFGEGAGVRGINLEVQPGTILGVIGPSGAGKTTTIRLITGGLKPTGGDVRVLGERPGDFSRATRERIGYMPQQFMLYPDLTVAENADFAASLFGMLLPRRRRRVREVLEVVDLWAVRSRRAGALSGGMQRRLELACAMVHEPHLLLLDEPTAGIDPLLRERIWGELARLRAAGRTLLVTTQYVAEAEQCDVVALIADGRLIALGEPEALRRRAAGGDVIEVETAGPFDPAELAQRSGVRSVESTGLRSFRVAADDAGSLLATIGDLVSGAGGTLTAAREARLSFDEVFARLVRMDADDRAAIDGSVPPAGADAGRAA